VDALVLGVNGMVGRAVAGALTRAGWVVSGTGRDRDRFPDVLACAGVTFHVSDRRDRRALAQVIGDGADLVVDCVCYTAAQAEQLLEHRDRIGSAIVVSSKAVYVDDHGNHSNSDQQPRFDAPVREDQHVMEPDYSGGYNSRAGYGANKVAAERVLLDAELPVTILRPSRIHGLGSSRPREWFFVRRVIDGRTRVPLARGGRTANHPTAAANLATLTAACAATAGRRVLNVADPDLPTAADIAVAVADACGSRLDVVGLPHEAPPELGSNPWADWPPFFLDTSASEAIPDYHPVPYSVTVAEEVRWLLSLDSAGREALNADPYFSDLFDYALDDRALAAYPT
jgi:nucleoside-diphosphate-sugar epimerase